MMVELLRIDYLITTLPSKTKATQITRLRGFCS